MNALVELMRRQVEELAQNAIPPSFRDFLGYVGADPSPVIAAIADASEGRLITLPPALCESTFGCAAADLPTTLRRTVVVRAGGRGGKTSRLIAPKAIHAALTVPLPTLAAGEHARAVIVAPDKALAVQALSFVRGYVGAHPALRRLVVESKSGASDDDDVGTTERVTLRRPTDGKLVDICIGAATRGGKAVRARTLVFVGLDEAAFFYADDNYTVTDAEIYRAAVQRVVPGGQIWIVSTPWIEGYGVLEERIAKDWGRHEHSLVAVGPTRALNPTWDPDGEIERDMRATDPDNAAREIDAVPLPAGTKLFFPPDAITAAVDDARAGDLPAVQGVRHWAGCDLGFRKNSSALALARRAGARVELACVAEMRPRPGEPLKPSEVCASFARVCLDYEARTMRGDLHYADTAHEELPKTRDVTGRRQVAYDEWTPTQETKAEAFTAFKRLLTERLVVLPNNPRLLGQMRRTAAREMPGGTVQIQLPKQGASHGDLLMAAVLACVQVPLVDGAGVRATKAGGGRWGDGAGRGW